MFIIPWKLENCVYHTCSYIKVLRYSFTTRLPFLSLSNLVKKVYKLSHTHLSYISPYFNKSSIQSKTNNFLWFHLFQNLFYFSFFSLAHGTTVYILTLKSRVTRILNSIIYQNNLHFFLIYSSRTKAFWFSFLTHFIVRKSFSTSLVSNFSYTPCRLSTLISRIAFLTYLTNLYRLKLTPTFSFSNGNFFTSLLHHDVNT